MSRPSSMINVYCDSVMIYYIYYDYKYFIKQKTPPVMDGVNYFCNLFYATKSLFVVGGVFDAVKSALGTETPLLFTVHIKFLS